MNIIDWLNSEKRKNWHIILLNIYLTLLLSLIIIPIIIYTLENINKRKFIFQGVVVNHKDMPIENAQIIIKGIGIEYSDKNGEFQIESQEDLRLGDIVHLESIPKDTTLHQVYYDTFEINQFNKKDIKIFQNEKQ